MRNPGKHHGASHNHVFQSILEGISVSLSVHKNRLGSDQK
jgi:hypothetical protein